MVCDNNYVNCLHEGTQKAYTVSTKGMLGYYPSIPNIPNTTLLRLELRKVS